MNEKLSALLDDELSSRERQDVLRHLAEDGNLRGAWERYHIMRAAIRKELDVVTDSLFAERVAQGISVPSTESAPAARGWALPAYTRWAAGFALAASVAAVAIINLQPLSSDTPPAQAAAQSAPAMSAVKPVSRSVTSLASQEASSTPAATRPLDRSPFNAFLVEHSEVSGASGMTPYVRVVGYSNEQ